MDGRRGLRWPVRGLRVGRKLEIVGCFQSVGCPEIVSNEVAWLRGVHRLLLQQGGISIAAIPLAERLLANSHLKIGRELAKDNLRVGAICVLSRGSHPASGHVSFIRQKMDRPGTPTSGTNSIFLCILR